MIEEIKHVTGKSLAGIIIQHIHEVLELKMEERLKMKSKKSDYLIKTNIKLVKYEVPIINISAHQLTTTENHDLNLD